MGKQDKETVTIKESDVAVLDLGKSGEVAVQAAPVSATEIIPSDYRALAKPTAQVKDIVHATLGAGIGAFDLDRIKVPSAESTMWSVPTIKGIVPQPYVDAIILEMRLSRSYWPEPVGVGAPVPPSCSSHDSVMGTGTPGGPCRKCPLAEFGTAVKSNGKAAKGQACRQGRMMLLLRPQDLIPVMLIIPPGSLKETGKFLMRFTQSDLDAKHCVMRFGLKQTQNSEGTKYNQVEMTMLRPLNTAELDRMISIQSMYADFFAAQTLEAEDVATDAQ